MTDVESKGDDRVRVEEENSHYALPCDPPMKKTLSGLKSDSSRWATRSGKSFRDSITLAWKGRPAGPKEANPSVRAFRNKLNNAFRSGLACFIATAVSMIYPWSGKVTWFSITLIIGGVGRNLGNTLEGMRQSVFGAVVAVPLCLLLSFCGFSRVFLGFLIFLVSVAVASTSLLNEPAKKICLIFIVWDVLIGEMSPTVTTVSLLIDLLRAVFGASIICVLVMIIPVPDIALWVCRWRLKELSQVMGNLLEDAIDSFCFLDDSELHDLEEWIDEATSLISEIRRLLPDVRLELSLFPWKGKEKAIAYDRLIRYLEVLEGQVENFRGMAVAVTDLYPNGTHSEFIAAMRPSLNDLVKNAKVVMEGVCNHILSGLRYRSYYKDEVHPELFRPLKAVLAQALMECLKTRMKVVYGVKLITTSTDVDEVLSSKNLKGGGAAAHTDTAMMVTHDTARNMSFVKCPEAMKAAENFAEESKKIGYMNLLPRNAFVLDLDLFVEAFDMYYIICNSQRAEVPITLWDRTMVFCRNGSKTLSAFWENFRRKEWKSYRQPLKVGLAITLANVSVLVDNNRLGRQTIWQPIAVAQTMSSHPASAFKSGANRILGTVLGAIYGLAVTEWITARKPVVVVALLTIWVFLCAFNRGSPSYGEVAVSAALTAPIIVIGPIMASAGVVVRIVEVILGTVIYVVVDNLLFPVRAKLLLRAQLCESVQNFMVLCEEQLSTFLAEKETLCEDKPTTTTKTNPEMVRLALKKQELFIDLATEEPELYHKPFQRQLYLKVHSIQLRMHTYLMMLHRSSMALPKQLAEWDQEMLKAYEFVTLRLTKTIRAVLSESLGRLHCLKNPELISDVQTVNLFDIRQEFSDIQDTIDAFMEDFFSKDPVLTSLSFIVPLNGMIYSIRKMSVECIKFATAVRHLLSRERPTGDDDIVYSK